MCAQNITTAFMAEVFKAGSPQLMKQYAGDKNTGGFLLLEDAILSQRLPYPLNLHFKAFTTVGDLLNSKAPRAYVVQCIQQTAITPLERAALLALLETMEIEQ